MRRSIILGSLLLVSLLFLSGCAWLFPPPLPLPEEPYAAPFDPEAITVDPATGAAIVSNQVIVRFKEGVAEATIEAVIAGLGCIIVGEIPMLNVYQLKIPDGAAPADLVDQFENSPHVQWAEVNQIVHVDTPAGSTSASGYKPEDNPLFSKQWALHNTGQTGGRVDADIDAPEAWVIEKGHPSVTIAILDTGVNYEHEDLRGNLRMPRGIVWDLIDNDTSPIDEGDPNRRGYGHGTAMTGVAVASMNNVGIIGVASQATFLPVRVFDQGHQVDAIGEKFAATTGMFFAYNRGNARVINMSFSIPRETFLLEDAIALLVNNNDVLLVTSAGNRNSSTPTYPAGFPGVMAVAATDHNDQRSNWGEEYAWRWWPPGLERIKVASNYGYWIDVSAPGGSRDGHSGDEKMIRSTGFPGDLMYGYTGGTSSAAAFVSGVAALIWSLDYRTGGGFDLSASEVKAIIKDSADNIDHLNPDYRGKLGTGRVNAYKALREAEIKLGLRQPPTAHAGPDQTVEVGTLVTLDGAGSHDPDDDTLAFRWTQTSGPDQIVLSDSWAERPTFTPTVPGTYTFQLVVNDGKYDSLPDEVTITVTAQSVSELNWSPRTPMPTPRAFAPAVVHQGRIYVVGGCSSSEYQQFYNAVGSLEAYDPALDTWTVLPSMPTPRVGPAAAVVENKIYVIGGFTRSTWAANSVMEVYDINSGQWSTGPSKPTPRSWARAAVWRDKIYVFGGVGYDYYNVCEVFDPATNRWSSCAPFSGARYLQAVVTANDKIYIIGGDRWGPRHTYDDIQVYDPFTDSWIARTPMPTAATALDAIVVNNKIWVFGGGGLCRVYDIVADRWEEKISMQNPTSLFSVAYLNGIVYRFGGGGWGPTLDVVEAAVIPP